MQIFSFRIIPRQTNCNARDEILDWHKIIREITGVVGVRSQRIRCVPKSFFNGFNVFELGHKFSLLAGIHPRWVGKVYNKHMLR